MSASTESGSRDGTRVRLVIGDSEIATIADVRRIVREEIERRQVVAVSVTQRNYPEPSIPAHERSSVASVATVGPLRTVSRRNFDLGQAACFELVDGDDDGGEEIHDLVDRGFVISERSVSVLGDVRAHGGEARPSCLSSAVQRGSDRRGGVVDHESDIAHESSPSVGGSALESPADAPIVGDATGPTSPSGPVAPNFDDRAGTEACS